MSKYNFKSLKQIEKELQENKNKKYIFIPDDECEKITKKKSDKFKSNKNKVIKFKRV